jgi:phosphoribosyl 1,2-cyclic phosphodiesterase
MLETGSYPPHLKARIRGSQGHLSNEEAAGLVRECRRKRPEWVAVAHLSEDNNLPELAIAAHHAATGNGYPVHHASRYECSDLLTV